MSEGILASIRLHHSQNAAQGPRGSFRLEHDNFTEEFQNCSKVWGCSRGWVHAAFREICAWHTLCTKLRFRTIARNHHDYIERTMHILLASLAELALLALLALLDLLAVCAWLALLAVLAVLAALAVLAVFACLASLAGRAHVRTCVCRARCVRCSLCLLRLLCLLCLPCLLCLL